MKINLGNPAPPTQDGNPHTIVSTGPALYVYTQTDQADSRRGYKFR